MSCFGPRIGYYSRELTALGKRSIVFDKRLSFSGVPIQIPCGECIGCLKAWQRQWAVRCIHEKRLWPLSGSAFLTLTYDDNHLPHDGSLELREFQKFMKRLRSVRPEGIRYFACGEYGTVTLRPHYHVLLFNTGFSDRRQVKLSPTGNPLYRSAELSGLWKNGEHWIGDVSNASCAYVAGYVMKKIGVPPERSDGRAPEFRVMSRRPGIGSKWFDRYYPEAYRLDSAVVQGREVPLPRYYDTKFESVDKSRLEELKRLRKARVVSNVEENTKARRLTREKFEHLKLQRFKRD